MNIRAVNCRARVRYKNGKTYFAVNTNGSDFSKDIKIICDDNFTVGKSSNHNYIPMANLAATGHNECIIICMRAGHDTFKIPFRMPGGNEIKNDDHDSDKQSYKSIADVPGFQLPKWLFD